MLSVLRVGPSLFLLLVVFLMECPCLFGRPLGAMKSISSLLENGCVAAQRPAKTPLSATLARECTGSQLEEKSYTNVGSE